MFLSYFSVALATVVCVGRVVVVGVDTILLVMVCYLVNG